MKPILYSTTESNFTSNGIGTLDCLTCTVKEERNGLFELEATISELAYHASSIQPNSIIKSKVPDQTDMQLFRVYKIKKSLTGQYVISAQHISYQLNYIPTMPFSVEGSQSACQSALTGLKINAVENCPFNFVTDVHVVSGFGLTAPVTIRSALGGMEGSILDRYGGEYLWNNYNVSLKAERGKSVLQKDVTLRYGKDITDIDQEEYISNTITGVVPYWQNTDKNVMVTLPEKVVSSQHASSYPFHRTVVLNCSQDFQDPPTVEQLRTHAQAYVNQTGIGVPTVSIKVKFISLDEEVANNLQRVKLCDNIGVEFVKLGISTTAKVVKYVYDVLAERYDSIEVGTIKPSLAQTISSTEGALETNLSKSIFEAKKATAWLTSSNGYVMAAKNPDGSWKELFFMDTNDAATAHNVLRINENGLGFSSTGVAGPYTQAWTLDGKLVIGGTNVPSLTVYDNQNNIIFQTSRSGTIWNSANSSMNAQGELEMYGANIRSSKTGARLIIDNTSSIKGVDQSSGASSPIIYNLINMIQSQSGSHQMTIDAHDQLNIRTPQLYVVNRSAGEGALTAYQTHTGEYTSVSNVTKNTSLEDCKELWVDDVGSEDGDVYCTLPVFLNVEKTTYNRYLGMTVTGETSRTVVI